MILFLPAALSLRLRFDVSGVTLEGEEAGDVPVYDTCNEIRKKIQANK